jgi:hypothetical protein
MTARVIVLRALIVAVVVAACAGTTGPSTASPASPGGSARPSASPGGVPSTLETKYAAAQSATTLFHLRFDQRNFDRLYSLTDPSFKRQVTASTFTADMSKLRDRVGASVNEDEIDADAYEEAGDAIVTIIMETTFQNAVLSEIFVWRVTPDENTFLMSYESQ